MAPIPLRRSASTARPSDVLVLVFALLLCAAAGMPALAGTDLDLSRRIVIDGLTDEIAEWEPDESQIQIND